MALDTAQVPGLAWQPYTADQNELIAAVDMDFTTYGAYQITAKGMWAS